MFHSPFCSRSCCGCPRSLRRWRVHTWRWWCWSRISWGTLQDPADDTVLDPWPDHTRCQDWSQAWWEMEARSGTCTEHRHRHHHCNNHCCCPFHPLLILDHYQRYYILILIDGSLPPENDKSWNSHVWIENYFHCPVIRFLKSMKNLFFSTHPTSWEDEGNTVLQLRNIMKPCDGSGTWSWHWRQTAHGQVHCCGCPWWWQ